MGSGHAHRGWYFIDNKKKRIPCCSGYEALFVVYLQSCNIPFDYQKWVFVGPSKYNSLFAYVPDFYLPKTDEFIELKGWPIDLKQAAAVRYLKRKGYNFKVIDWDKLRQLLNIHCTTYTGCLHRAERDFKNLYDAFTNTHWVTTRLNLDIKSLRRVEKSMGFSKQKRRSINELRGW